MQVEEGVEELVRGGVGQQKVDPEVDAGPEEFSFTQPTGPRVDESSNSPIDCYSQTVTPEVIRLIAEETNK